MPTFTDRQTTEQRENAEVAMKHNYTVLITGTMTETSEPVEQRNLATFAFADQDPARIAELKLLAAEATTVIIYCDQPCFMFGRVKFVDESDSVAWFHFHLDELRTK